MRSWVLIYAQFMVYHIIIKRCSGKNPLERYDRTFHSSTSHYHIQSMYLYQYSGFEFITVDSSFLCSLLVGTVPGLVEGGGQPVLSFEQCFIYLF